MTDILATIYEADYYTVPTEIQEEEINIAPEKIPKRIAALGKEMKEHAKKLRYEEAAKKRDEIKKLRELEIKYAGEIISASTES